MPRKYDRLRSGLHPLPLRLLLMRMPCPRPTDNSCFAALQLSNVSLSFEWLRDFSLALISFLLCSFAIKESGLIEFLDYLIPIECFWTNSSSSYIVFLIFPFCLFLCLNGLEDFFARWCMFSPLQFSSLSRGMQEVEWGVTLSKMYAITYWIRLTVHTLYMRSTTSVNQQRYEVSLLCPEGTQTLTPVQISQIFSSCLQLHTIDRC